MNEYCGKEAGTFGNSRSWRGSGWSHFPGSSPYNDGALQFSHMSKTLKTPSAKPCCVCGRKHHQSWEHQGAEVILQSLQCREGRAIFFFWSHSWRPLHTHLSWAFYSSRQDPSMFNSKGLFFPLYFSVPMKVPCVWEKFNQNLGFKKYKVNAYIYAPTLIMVHNPQLIFCNLAGYSWVGGGYVCMWLSMMCTPWGRTPQLEFIWEVLPAIV